LVNQGKLKIHNKEHKYFNNNSNSKKRQQKNVTKTISDLKVFSNLAEDITFPLFTRFTKDEIKNFLREKKKTFSKLSFFFFIVVDKLGFPLPGIFHRVFFYSHGPIQLLSCFQLKNDAYNDL
jgi:hypothetical protein